MFPKSRPLSFNKGNGKPSEAAPGCQINGWLLKAIDPGNIRLHGTRMEIHLWREWPQMLADLPALGITLAVSRNASAVLGRKGVYPDLEFSCDVFCGFGKDCDRLLEQAGATRLRECECCDLNHDERLPNWAREIATLLAKPNPQLVSE